MNKKYNIKIIQTTIFKEIKFKETEYKKITKSKYKKINTYSKKKI